jgi:hypothetical protein
MMDVVYDLIDLKTGETVGNFPKRGDAVYHAMVNRTLPLPDSEWDDEFDIVERKLLSTKGK